MEQQEEITRWLIEISKGSAKAYDKLFSMVYEHLSHMAYQHIAGESAGHTYSKTDLVHEVYLKLVNQDKVEWKDRTHFYAIAARSMRQILIDYARKKKRLKRGGSASPVTFIDEIMNAEHQADELLQIDEALSRLGRLDERLAKIVELHYYGEMNFDDIGELLELSPRTVYRDWSKARGWLYKELKEQ